MQMEKENADYKKIIDNLKSEMADIWERLAQEESK